KMELKAMKKLFSHRNLVFAIIIIGIFARGFRLGSVPGGINMDEAFGAYEGYSLLHYGMDSHGYSFPVYLETWGSGMSALNSYLMLPFIALFGLHTWVIRLPQFIASCFTLPVVYKLLRRMINRDAALTGLLYIAVCPWSVMYARWGLDCNLAPAFLLFGFYFFVSGVENTKYYLLSALFYGLSLYCYATIWPVVPVMLVLMSAYLIYTRQLRIDLYSVSAVLLLGLLALPLILFLLVNNGYISEIVTPFISIPALSAMRESEISFSDILWKLKLNIIMILKQDDGLYWNFAGSFGLYYRGFLIFGAVGGLFCLKRFITSIARRSYSSVVMLLFPFLCGLMLCALISANFNRINCLHIPISLFIALGLYFTAGFLKNTLNLLLRQSAFYP
ncbi:MAG: glycosyltransferase family 39 protein, partial [Lachnospiraceae bacterium]|nr:glycosyltransferase family 39 protein [Lachnospiraceae bacterium]